MTTTRRHMMYRVFLLATAAALAVLAAASGAAAKPAAVTLFPQGARVTEQIAADVMTEGDRIYARFFLPVHAAKDTLTVQIPPDAGMTLLGVNMDLQTIEAVDRIAELEKRLRERNQEKSRIDARIRALTTTVAYWEHLSKNLPETVDSVEKIGEAIGRGITDAASAILPLQQALEPIMEEIEALRRELDNLTGRAEKQWQATVFFNRKTVEKVNLTCAYYISNCRWQPVYTLNARPEKSDIAFSWYADISQETGVNWENVQITLATAQARPRPEPPQLRPWIIQPREEVHPMRMKSDRALMQAPAAADSAAVLEESSVGAPEPERQAGFLFDTYDLGLQTIPSGENRQVVVRSESWKADFQYLVRPYEDRLSFLFAQIVADEEPFIRLPEGKATFLIDGAMVTVRSLSLFDPETRLFFGSDPGLDVTFDVVEKKSDEKGLFGGKKAYRWHWRLTLTNRKPHDVIVVVEDALPQIRDGRIKLEEKIIGPAPVKEADRLTWDLNVPAGRETTLEYGFAVTYPSDMDLSFGGR
jgi:uncharacterized protein (TIGR02231 family)